MIEFIGIACLSLGVGIVYATWKLGRDERHDEPAGTPRYVRHARMLASRAGYPEKYWRLFKDRAIAEVIYNIR
jgi:hypothetical protein